MLLPLVTLAVFAGIGAWYYYFYVPSRVAYFDARAFRLLALEGNKLQGTVAGVSSVFMAASYYPDAQAKRKDFPGGVNSSDEYLKINLEIFGATDGTIKTVQRYTKPRQYRDGRFLLWGRSEDGIFRVHARYQHPPVGPSLLAAGWGCTVSAPQDPDEEGEERGCFFARAELNLEPESRQSISAINEDFFEDVLLVGSSGKVLFQYSSAGPRIQDLSALVGQATATSQPQKAVVQTQETGGAGAPAGKANAPAKTWAVTLTGTSGEANGFSTAARSDSALVIRAGGSEYKVYVHPLVLPVSDELGTPVPLVLCGLRSERQMRSDTYSLPYTYVIVTALLLLTFLALAWPALKLSYVSPQERLQHGHVLLIMVSTMVATALLTLLVLNGAYTNSIASQSVESRLRGMAYDLKRNVHQELEQAVNTLDTCSDEAYLRSLDARPDWNPVTSSLAGYASQEQPLCGSRSWKDVYPYFRFITWLDKNGLQVFKLAADPKSTPQTNLVSEDFFRLVAGCGRDPESLRQSEGCELSHLDGKGDDLESGYRVQPTYSQNTDEFLAVVSKPYQAPPNSQDLPERIRSLRAKIIILRFESLVDAVLPPNYGFAVLDPDGKVQFHVNKSRNLIENFLVESQRDPVMQAAIAGGIEQFLELNYLGNRHDAYVLPLQDFQKPRWTLVVFRNASYFSTLSMHMNLLFLLLFGVYSLPFLLWAVSHMLRDAEYPLESIWPVRWKKRNYAQILISAAFLAIVFQGVYTEESYAEVVISLFGLVLVGGVFPFWQGAKAGDWSELAGKSLVAVELIWLAGKSWYLLFAALYLVILSPWIAPRLERWLVPSVKLRFIYIAAVTSILILLVVGPCCALFKLAFETVERLHAESRELALQRSLVGRNQRLGDYYGRIKAPGLLKIRLAETLDRYDTVPTGDNEEMGTKTSLGLTLLDDAEWAVSNLLLQNRLSAEFQMLTSPGAASLQFMVVTSPAARGRLPTQFLQLNAGDLSSGLQPIGAHLPVWPGLLGSSWVVLLLSFAAIMIWLDLITRKVFLIELQNLPALDPWETKQGVRWNLLIIGHPKSGKISVVSDLPDSETVDLAEIATSGGWQGVQPQQRNVILRHFEHEMGSPETNLRKLELLEWLLYVAKKKVVILSTVDPLIYLTAGGQGIVTRRETHAQGSRRVLDRWAAALSGFTKARIIDKSEAKFDESIARFRRWCADDASQRFADRVQKECDHTAHLRKFGRMLLWPREQKLHPSQELMVEEVLDRADAYYWTLWATCTQDERLVLFQLAKDGWVNPKNEVAIQQLQRRALITRDSGFRIMNESFRRFILKNEYPEEIARWEREGAESAWGAVRLSMGMGVLLLVSWVLFAQQQDVGAVAGILGAAGAIIGPVYKLVSDLRRPGGGAGISPPGARAA